MTAPLQEKEEMLLQAYCDGELDPTTAADVERRLASNDALRARHDQIMALRNALRALPQDDLPPLLLARTRRIIDGERKTSIGRIWQASWRGSWQAMAASAVIGAIIAGSALTTIDRYQQRQEIGQAVAGQLVASHIRGLLAPQPYDVESSDRHTVKPWFATHVPESPLVLDLTAQGFVLAGGRVDVIGDNPVATAVYRHAKHIVSLIALPPGRAVPNEAIAGYNIVSWNDGSFTYVAVSDIPRDDLANFESAFRKAAAEVH